MESSASELDIVTLLSQWQPQIRGIPCPRAGVEFLNGVLSLQLVEFSFVANQQIMPSSNLALTVSHLEHQRKAGVLCMWNSPKNYQVLTKLFSFFFIISLISMYTNFQKSETLQRTRMPAKDVNTHPKKIDCWKTLPSTLMRKHPPKRKQRPRVFAMIHSSHPNMADLVNHTLPFIAFLNILYVLDKKSYLKWSEMIFETISNT